MSYYVCCQAPCPFPRILVTSPFLTNKICFKHGHRWVNMLVSYKIMYYSTTDYVYVPVSRAVIPSVAICSVDVTASTFLYCLSVVRDTKCCSYNEKQLINRKYVYYKMQFHLQMNIFKYRAAIEAFLKFNYSL